MYKNILIVFFSILTFVSFDAKADAYHFEQQTSKHLETLFKQLDAIGIDDPQIKDFITRVDQRSQKGEVDLTEEKIDTGMIKIRYVTHSEKGPGIIKQNRFQLVYTPDFVDHTDLVAARGSVMIKFHIDLE